MNFEPKVDFYCVISPKPFPYFVIIWLKTRDGTRKCRSVQTTCSNSYTRLILMLAGLIVDIILCMSRFIAEYVHPTTARNEEDNKPLSASMNLLYFGKSQDGLAKFTLYRWLTWLVTPYALASAHLDIICQNFLSAPVQLFYLPTFFTSPPFDLLIFSTYTRFSPNRSLPHLFPQYHIHFPKRLFSTGLFNLLTLSNSLCLPLHVLYCIKIPCISQLLYFTTLYTFHSFQTSTRYPFILI